MSGIVLSAGVRSNLLNLQQTSDLITSTQEKLATGKRVNSALDNPLNYFTAQSLDNRASDLSNLLDSMSTAINTIQAANNGISSITKLVQSAQSLISQAQQTSDTTVRASLSSQFDSLLSQIGQLAGDFGFNGINLLGGDLLTVTLDETNNASVTVTGVDYSNASNAPLSIGAAANSWASSADITAASTELTTALTSLRSEFADVELEPVHRADPSGLHQGHDQHPAGRLRRPHACGLQPGRRELAGLADPPAALDHGPVARFAGRPERAAAVPVSRPDPTNGNGGLRAAVFLSGWIWLTAG